MMAVYPQVILMRHILLLASTLLLAAPAFADTLQTFNLNAIIEDRNFQTGTVAGTVELDTTTGLFVKGDFKIAYLGALYLFDTTVTTFGIPGLPPPSCWGSSTTPPAASSNSASRRPLSLAITAPPSAQRSRLAPFREAVLRAASWQSFPETTLFLLSPERLPRRPPRRRNLQASFFSALAFSDSLLSSQAKVRL